MSKGNTVVTLRFDKHTLFVIDSYISMTATTRHKGAWDRSEFIRSAVNEKLRHIARSGNARIAELIGYTPSAGSKISGDTPGGNSCPPEVQVLPNHDRSDRGSVAPVEPTSDRPKADNPS